MPRKNKPKQAGVVDTASLQNSYHSDYKEPSPAQQKFETEYFAKYKLANEMPQVNTVDGLCASYNIDRQKVSRLTALGLNLETISKIIWEYSDIEHQKVYLEKKGPFGLVGMLPDRVYQWERINSKLDALERFAEQLSERDLNVQRVRLHEDVEDIGATSIEIYQKLIFKEGTPLLSDGVLNSGPKLKEINRDIFLYQYFSALNDLAKDNDSKYSMFSKNPFENLTSKTKAYFGEKERSSRIGRLTDQEVVNLLPELDRRFEKLEIDEQTIVRNDSQKGVAYQYFRSLGLFKDKELLGEETLSLFDKLGGANSNQLLYNLNFVKNPSVFLSGKIKANAELISQLPPNFFGKVRAMDYVADEFLDRRVLAFAKEIGPLKAQFYINFLFYQESVSTGADKLPKPLLDKRMLDNRIFGSADFIKSLPEMWAYSYFRAIFETGAVGILTDRKVTANKLVKDIVQMTDKDQPTPYFEALARTGDLRLTESEYTGRILQLDKASRSFLSAIAALGSVDALFSARVMRFSDYLLFANHGMLLSRYLNTLTGGNAQDLTSDRFLGYFTQKPAMLVPVLDALGKRGDIKGQREHSQISGQMSWALMHLLQLSEKMPVEFENARSRLAELIRYGGTLGLLGYNAKEEMEFLVKKGDRAYISRLAHDVSEALDVVYKSSETVTVPFPLRHIPQFSEWYEDRKLAKIRRTKNRETDESIESAKGFIAYRELLSRVSQFRSAGIALQDIIEALDNCAALIGLDEHLSKQMHTRIFSNINSVFAVKKVSEKRLRQRYGEIFEYMERHRAGGSVNRSSSLIKESYDQIIANLSICYGLNKELSIKTVKREKNILSKGAKVEMIGKYEQHFVTEIEKAVNSARYSSFMEYTSVHSAILRAILGREVKLNAIPAELKNAVEGYLTVDHNKEHLGKLIEIYALEGAQAATRWAYELGGNRQVLKVMSKRGTDIGQINKFEVSFAASKPMDFVEKNKIRVAQIYSEIISLVHQLGYGDLEQLGVKRSGKTEQDAVAIYQKLLKISEEKKFVREQKLIIEDIKDHINGIRTSVGQLYAAEEGARLKFFISADPIQKMQLGVGFNSCLDIRRGAFSYGAVARGIDANNIVLYASKVGDAGTVGRVSLVDTDSGLLVNSGFYENTVYDLHGKENGWVSAIAELSRSANRSVLIPTRFVDAGGSMAAALIESGFVLKRGIGAKIDRAVCAWVYSDLYPNERLGSDGTSLVLDAYVMNPKEANPKKAVKSIARA